MDAIVLEKVCKSFGGKKALDHVSLAVAEKKLIFLNGPNGSGKTTLLNIIAGAMKQTSGKAEVAGRVGYCHQVPQTCEELTVKENLEFFSKVFEARDGERVKELIALVGLNEWMETVAGELSTGMKKRLEIAVALLADPEIMIFDEPTTGVDAETKEKIIELVKKMKGKKTVLIASHETADFQKTSDETIGIEKGKIKKKE